MPVATPVCDRLASCAWVLGRRRARGRCPAWAGSGPSHPAPERASGRKADSCQASGAEPRARRWRRRPPPSPSRSTAPCRRGGQPTREQHGHHRQRGERADDADLVGGGGASRNAATRWRMSSTASDREAHDLLEGLDRAVADGYQGAVTTCDLVAIIRSWTGAPGVADAVRAAMGPDRGDGCKGHVRAVRSAVMPGMPRATRATRWSRG